MADDFNPEALFQALDRHRVTFVLIGGYAAQLQGARRPTVDLDVTPERTLENLARLAAALKDIDARIRVDAIEDGLPFSADATSLSGMEFLNLTTRHGDLDITLTPAGTHGFTDLAEHAERLKVAGVEVLVASLADIIRSKEAASGPKDIDALPELDRLARTSSDIPEYETSHESETDWSPGPPATGGGYPAR